MKRVFIAGHKGMVGSAILRKLQLNGSIEIITRSRNELDLLDQDEVNEFFKRNEIDEVYLAAAKVGGIHANNSYSADFLYENLMIQANIINAVNLANIDKLLFLGSSCIYPKFAEQPIKEEYLLSGHLEPTNEAYAIAKITGIKLCESYNRQFGRDYRSIMPTNLYGVNDNFHPENSHVIPGLIRRFHEAKVQRSEQVIAWGSGKPLREFLIVDELADASIHIMNLDKDELEKVISPMMSHINVGSGQECSIKTLVETISEVVGYKGDIVWDDSKPDGTPRKLLDVTKLEKLGWKSTVTLKEGLMQTYEWFLTNQEAFRSK